LYFRGVWGVNERTLLTRMGDVRRRADSDGALDNRRESVRRYASRIILQYSIFIVTVAPVMIEAKVMIDPSASVEKPAMP
jgi:hypothetical protein